MTKSPQSLRSPKTAGSGNPQSKRTAKPNAIAAGAGAAAGVDQESGAVTTPKAPGGKLGVVVTMLERPEGATVAQISAATDWQAHSVRGAFAGALKKKHGLTIVSQPAEGGRVYRLGDTAA